MDKTNKIDIGDIEIGGTNEELDEEKKTLTIEELRKITGLDIMQMNRLNHIQLNYPKEVEMLRVFETYCVTAISMVRALVTAARNYRKATNIEEHDDFAEVCEQMSIVFSGKLNTARRIHSETCKKEHIPLPAISLDIPQSMDK